MKKLLMAAAVALMPMGALAQDFEKGMAAYQSGDYATALQEWRPLAEQGNAQAQSNLGLMYRHGKGVPQNDANALKFFHFAATQGNAQAQSEIGLMYRHGYGVPQNNVEAMKWLRLAAEQGDASTMSSLGWMYRNGNGVPQDYIAAHMWYNLGSANGNEQAGMNRDELAATMTPEDISEAQRRARVCMSSNYQDCD